jgi:hypothetical protein
MQVRIGDQFPFVFTNALQSYNRRRYQQCSLHYSLCLQLSSDMASTASIPLRDILCRDEYSIEKSSHS